MQRCPETPVNGVPRHHTVGLTGFEPAASSSRTRRATKLRHSPMPRFSGAEASLTDRSRVGETGGS